MRAWLLPENIEDVLPPKAWRLEGVRRAMLDLFRGRGYELVVPPLIEYVDSLLTGAGTDLDLKTFKLVDQLSGRMMGVRADMTPQAARIDAHLLGHNPVNRLCYAGSVLHTVPDGVYRSREPMQLGAELYGVAGVEGDLEILSLMLDALQAAGLRNIQLDVGHVGIYRALVEQTGLSAELEDALFKALQSKAADEVAALCAGLDTGIGKALVALTRLYGGAETLQAARATLPDDARIRAALDTLAHLIESLQGRGIELALDFAELRGYGYHSGVVFAAYTGGHSRAIALGGRYDEAGKAFGRARPATGFSLDLRELVEAAPGE